MGAIETAATLTGFERRGAGTNAERRAALWLSGELRTPRRDATLETFWCRPNWALTHAWHAGFALIGSLVSVASPQLGGAIILIALLSLVLDALAGASLGRRLTSERASQNVVSHAGGAGDLPVTLIITANYDAGRTGLVYRPFLRRLPGSLRAVAGRLTPGWLGWVALAAGWVLITAGLRATGAHGTAIGIAQLPPTVALLLAFALLLELATADFGPSAGDNATGTAVALALVRALDVSPPRNLHVEAVLQGSGDGAMLGLRRHLRTHRERAAANTVVLGIAACGAGRPVWWTGDGSLIPLRFLPRLAQTAARVAGASPHLGAAPHRGRGISPAYPARFAGLPAITLGCVDPDGLAPGSHQPGDVPATMEPAAVDGLLELALTLVDAIDAELAGLAGGRAAAS